MITSFAGWRGTGATTAALVVAAALAERHGAGWFVEADPAGGVLAGRCRAGFDHLGGLERLAFGVGTDEAEGDPARWAWPVGSLSIVLAPADPYRADACHRPRRQWLPAIASAGDPVVIDVGRLRAASPARPVIDRSAHLVLVSTPEVGAMVSAAEWLQAAGRVSSVDEPVRHADLRIVVVDAPGGVRFPERTLEHELGEAWAGWLPWDPAAVELLHAGVPLADRRLHRSRLGAAAREVAARLAPVVADAPRRWVAGAAPAPSVADVRGERELRTRRRHRRIGEVPA